MEEHDLKIRAKNDFLQGKCLQALHVLNQYLEQNPNDDDAILFKARILANENIWGYLDKEIQQLEPIDLINRAIEINPKNSLAWNQMGLILTTEKKYGEALRCYNIALQYQLDNYDIIFNKGCLMLEMNSFEEAISLFQKCLQQNSHDSQVLFEIAKAYAALRKKDKMLRFLELTFTSSENDHLQIMVQKGYPSFKHYVKDKQFKKVCFKKNKPP